MCAFLPESQANLQKRYNITFNLYENLSDQFVIIPGRCGAERRFESGRIEADKRRARLVTAQVLRLLDSARRALAKKELFAVKGPERRQPLPRTMRSPPRIAAEWPRLAVGWSLAGHRMRIPPEIFILWPAD